MVDRVRFVHLRGGRVNGGLKQRPHVAKNLKSESDWAIYKAIVQALWLYKDSVSNV